MATKATKAKKLIGQKPWSVHWKKFFSVRMQEGLKGEYYRGQKRRGKLDIVSRITN